MYLETNYSINYKAIIKITASNMFVPDSLLKALQVLAPFILTIT